MDAGRRQVAIDDRLWKALQALAAEVGRPPDQLVEEALVDFLRRRGHSVLPGTGAGTAAAGAKAGMPPPLAAAEPPTLERPAVARPPSLPTAVPRQRTATVAGRRPPSHMDERTGSRAAALVLEDDTGRTWKVDKDRFVIGRGRHCDLVLDSAQVSREHAAIVRTAAGWFLEDLGSSNGTWVARRRIDRHPLADGEEFFITAERLRVRAS